MKLEQIVANPALIDKVNPNEVASMVTRLASITTALSTKLPAPELADRLVTPAEAAKILSVSRSSIYNRASLFPFTVRTGGRLRFSYKGIQKYIASRMR